MEAIVLAGGRGTRLRPVVSDLPKPMAPVSGRPFLEILLTKLSRSGVTHCVLSLGYMAEAITSHFGTSFDTLSLDYVIEDQALGTGGATRLAMTKCTSDHVFVFNGDTYLGLEMDEAEKMWVSHKETIIVGCPVPDTQRYGRLDVADGMVKGFSEKGIVGPGLINAGCYILPTDQLDVWPLEQPFSMETDHLIPLLEREDVRLFETAGIFIDIGIPEDYHRAQSLLVSCQ